LGESIQCFIKYDGSWSFFVIVVLNRSPLLFWGSFLIFNVCWEFFLLIINGC
jgi:hypothetical protein